MQKKSSYLQYKHYNLAIYEVNIFEKNSTLHFNGLKEDSMVEFPKNKI
jgi:hypothetical protein